jgi:hypothetical protein
MKRDDLLIAAARVLYKFSEGREDWTEWDELATAIENETGGRGPYGVVSRVSEFRKRQQLGMPPGQGGL